MRFCSQCGSQVQIRIPEGDNRDRYICDECGVIHYQNPKIVAGCVVEHDDRILLCRRAIEPRYGLWTLPAGFLENGEAAHAGAARETMEEAMADVDVLDLYTMITLTHADQVYLMFRAEMKTLQYGPGIESLEVELLREDEIPWDEIAFPVIETTLRLYLEDRKRGEFKTHIGEMRTKFDAQGKRYTKTRIL